MMRKLLYSFLFFIFLHAAVFGQTASTYCFTTSNNVAYNNLTGFTIPAGMPTTATDDAISNSVPMTFNFVFGGLEYSQLKISNNGWITFGNTNDSFYENNSTQNINAARPVIAPFWDDLRHGNNLAPRYFIEGSTGSRIFKVEWLQQFFFNGSTGDVISFQVWLYEGSNKIEFRYRQGSVSPGVGISATIGIFDAASTHQTLNNSGVSQVNTINTNINARPNTSQLYTFTPPATITAGANRTVCQNTAITNITMTLGSGATGATVTGLPGGVTGTISGNTLTIGGTPTVIGTFNYTVTVTGSCNPGTASGQITVNGANNVISYSNGNSGQLCGTAPEHNNATVAAPPSGTYFSNVSFASYGLPNGSCGSFTVGNSCHSALSQTVSENLILGKSTSVDVLAENSVFTDGCVGTEKRLYISANYSQPICSGATPTITGTTVGSGVYLWESSQSTNPSSFINASGTNNNANYTPSAGITQDTYFRRKVTVNGCTNISGLVLIKVNPNLPASVSIAASPSNVICSGTSVTFTATPTNGGTVPTYQWYNGSTAISGATGSTYTSTGLANSDVITVRMTSNATCATGSPATSNQITMTVNPNLPASVSIAASPSNVICSGASVTFTATPTNGGTVPTYQWYNGSTAISGATGSTYTSTGLANSNVITVRMTSNATCATGSPSTSNQITMTVNPNLPASVSIAASPSNVICSGTSVTFTATPTNGGTVPTYQWYNGSTAISGATGSTYTSTGLANSNVITVRMTSNATCATGSPSTSNQITMIVNPNLPASVSIAASPSNVICSGASVTFTATPTNGGTVPTYQWYNGSTAISGATGSTYTSTGLANSNVVTVRMTSNATCATGSPSTSNQITMTVNPNLPASVSIAASPSNVICSGASVTFTATPTNGGTVPTYQWYNGSTPISGATGSTYTSTGLANSNVITVRMTSNATCATGSPATSNQITMTVNPLPTTPTITKNNDAACNTLGSITITGLSANWTVNQTGTTTLPKSYPVTGTSLAIQDLAPDTYYFTVTNDVNCTSSSATVTITDISSNTDWSATGWTNGEPDGSKSVTISSLAFGQPFTIAKPNVEACSLTITVGADVIVPEGVTLTITNKVSSNGKLVFESGSSLLQTTNVQNDGEIVYKRKADVRRFDLTYWSSPVKSTKPGGFKMKDLSPTTLADKFFTYSPTGGWATDMSGESEMKIGNGYSIRGPQEFDNDAPRTFTGSFTGVPNNGDIPVTSVVADRWFLFGNPYPSAIDVDELWDVNPDLGPLYFYIHASLPQKAPGDNTYRYSSNDYIVHSSSGSTSVGGKTFGGYIAAGQGFFAKPKTNSIHFNNDMRKGASVNSNFFKTAKSKSIERNRVWLNMVNAEGAFKQILVGYIEGATNNVDFNYDAPTISGNSFIDFYSLNETKKLTIQGRALPFDNTDIVPLGYKTTAAGDFTIGIDHGDGFFDKQEIYLEDKVTGKTTNLRNENYTFSTLVGTFTDRFVLRYTGKTLGTDDLENLENSVLISVKNKTVSITCSKETIKEVNIFNVGAQLVYSKNKVNSSELQIANLHSSDQVLLVKVTLENGSTVTKKVIFSNL
jgi:hypothetical protein